MAQGATEEPFKILFIGDSGTYWNAGFAYYFEKLTASMNPPLIVEANQEAKPAFTLDEHWLLGEGVAVKKIRKGNYDVVVIQGSGDLNPEVFYEYAPKFIEEINKVGAKPVMFMEWPSQNNDYPIEPMIETNEKVAAEFGLDVIPTGLAWVRSKNERPDLNLYDNDGNHGNVAGSYLAVCVVYATLFNQSPVGASYLPTPEGSLSAEDAAFLQQIAWETVQEYKGR